MLTVHECLDAIGPNELTPFAIHTPRKELSRVKLLKNIGQLGIISKMHNPTHSAKAWYQYQGRFAYLN